MRAVTSCHSPLALHAVLCVKQAIRIDSTHSAASVPQHRDTCISIPSGVSANPKILDPRIWEGSMLPAARKASASGSKLPAAVQPAVAEPERIRLGNDALIEHGLSTDVRNVHEKRADDALLHASRAALRELKDFALAVPPAPDSLAARMMLLQTVVFRFLLLMLPCGGCCRARLRARRTGERLDFFQALMQLGGVEKAYTLMVVARFDRDQDGTIDDEERKEYEKAGDRLVANAIAGCQNTALVATLMIGAAHLANIGRPTPWAASQAFVAAFGGAAADVLLGVVSVFNVLVEAGALTLLLYSSVGRVLLVYVLPTMGARLTYIVESDLPGVLSTSITLLVVCMLFVLGLGALLASPRYGFIALAVGPALFIPALVSISHYWFQATLVLVCMPMIKLSPLAPPLRVMPNF